MVHVRKRILISGASGVTSRSVVRSLKLSSFYKDSVFVGMDICDNLYGIFEGLYDSFYKVPRSDDVGYRDAVEAILKKEKIDLAVIIPEPEVLYWCENPFDVGYLKIPTKFARIAISKKKLYEALSDTDLIPHYQIISKDEIDTIKLNFPMWVRDYSEGTTSGKGSFMPKNKDQLEAWFIISPTQNSFMVSQVLPGKNYACFLLYKDGKLLKTGVAERIDYFMSKVSISGITGNTAKGKLLNDEVVRERSKKAVQLLCEQTGETMNGLITVDLKGDKNNLPFVTEINLRHVAFTSSFANAGFNLAEYQLLCAEDRVKELSPEIEKLYPGNNLILRDIDGLPIYLEDFKEPKQITGERVHGHDE